MRAGTEPLSAPPPPHPACGGAAALSYSLDAVEKRPDRSEKLISLTYALLTTRVGYTRAQLRGMVEDYRGLSDEAFERKFERDKESLRSLGLVIVDGRGHREDQTAERGTDRERRYRILASDYRLPPLRLDPLEAAVLGLAAQVLAGGGMGRQTTRAAERLGVADLAAPGLFLPRIDAGTDHLEPLLRHAAAGTPVTFGYRAADGTRSRRTVVPWGLGHRHGQWYLAAGDTSRDNERLFRLDRIEGKVAQANAKADDHLAEAYGRPDRFDMAAALDRLERATPTLRAEVLPEPGRGGTLAARALRRRTQAHGEVLTVEYSEERALAAEAAGEGATVLAPASAARTAAAWWRETLVAQTAPAPTYSLSRHAGGRVSAEQTAARAIDLVCYVVSQGEASPEELMQRFRLSRSELERELMRLSVCGVPNGLHDELLDVEWDEERVSISNASVLAAPMNLSLAEAAGVLLGLDALASAPAGTLGDPARQAVDALSERLRSLRPELADFDRIVAVRAATRDAGETVGRLAAAIEEGHPVRLRYAAGTGFPERDVEPVRLLETGGHTYLQAWCRLRRGPRSFRLDRIVEAEVLHEHTSPDPAHVSAVIASDLRPGPDATEVELAWRGSWAGAWPAYQPERTAQLDDGVVTSLRVHDLSSLVSLVARSGGAVTVTSPPEIVEMVSAALRRGVEAADAAVLAASGTARPAAEPAADASGGPGADEQLVGGSVAAGTRRRPAGASEQITNGGLR